MEKKHSMHIKIFSNCNNLLLYIYRFSCNVDINLIVMHLQFQTKYILNNDMKWLPIVRISSTKRNKISCDKSRCNIFITNKTRSMEQ